MLCPPWLCFFEQFEPVVSCVSVGEIRWQPALTDIPIQQFLAAHSTWHFALWWQGCRVLFIPNAYSCRLKLPLVGISARLCSKKNWRKPSALNRWNSGCPAYDFYKKGKLFWLPARKSLLLKDSLAQLAITPHLEYMYFKVSLKLLSHQRVHRKSFKFFNQIFWFISHQ